MSTEQGPLILVVDDYEDAREMYAEYLQLLRLPRGRGDATATRRSTRPFTLMPDSDPDGFVAARHGRLGGDARSSRRTSGRGRFPWWR